MGVGLKERIYCRLVNGQIRIRNWRLEIARFCHWSELRAVLKDASMIQQSSRFSDRAGVGTYAQKLSTLLPPI
jgi:hypothetical protein